MKPVSLVTWMCVVCGPLLVERCSAIDCHQCSGDFQTSACGLNFVAESSTVGQAKCGGVCLVTVTDSSYVTRDCSEDQIIPTGCFNDDSNRRVCVDTCNRDLCNTNSPQDAIKPVVVRAPRPAAAVVMCYTCSGLYASSPCGYNFNDADPTVTLEQCDGICTAVTTDYDSVSRQCDTNVPQSSGCKYDNAGQLVCVHACDTNLCNGGQVLPEPSRLLCYQCSGSYDRLPCGYDFDSGNALVTTVSCTDGCMALATDYSSVERGCLPSTATPGCQTNNLNHKTCTYTCNQDLCNGDNFLPFLPEPTTGPFLPEPTTGAAVLKSQWTNIVFIVFAELASGYFTKTF